MTKVQDKIDEIVNKFTDYSSSEQLRLNLEVLVAMAEKEQIEKDYESFQKLLKGDK